MPDAARSSSTPRPAPDRLAGFGTDEIAVFLHPMGEPFPHTMGYLGESGRGEPQPTTGQTHRAGPTPDSLSIRRIVRRADRRYATG